MLGLAQNSEITLLFAQGFDVAVVIIWLIWWGIDALLDFIMRLINKVIVNFNQIFSLSFIYLDFVQWIVISRSWVNTSILNLVHNRISKWTGVTNLFILFEKFAFLSQWIKLFFA
jgi:hypothetical protein